MNGRLVKLCCAVMLYTACRTAPTAAPGTLVDAPVTAPDVPVSLAEADGALREYLRVTQLGAFPEDAQKSEDVFGALLRWKSSRMAVATAPFEAALTRNAEPEIAEFAMLRLGIAELNFGCEVAQLPPPGHLTEAQQGIVSDVIDRTAFKSVQEARSLFDAAAALNGRRQALLQRLLEGLPDDEGGVDAACVANRTAWAAPDAAGLDEIAAGACADGEGDLCWVWAAWGGGSEAALEKACDLDVAHACVDLADRRVVFMRPQSTPADAVVAEGLYRKACDLGQRDGCRKELAVFVPSQVDEYRTACLDDEDPVACVKLTRTLALASPDQGLWWSCTGSKERVSPELVAEQCRAGDAFSCAERAGSLKVDERYVVRIELDAADDPAKAALDCHEGATPACASGARAFARSGDWGCAVALMVEGCGRGDTIMCGFAEVD